MKYSLRRGAFQEFSLENYVNFNIHGHKKTWDERKKKLERRGEVVSNGQKHLALFFTETPMKCLQPKLEQMKPGRCFALVI